MFCVDLRKNSDYFPVIGVWKREVCVLRGRSWIRKNMWASESLKPNRSRVYVVFLGPGANSELVANMHVAIRASYAALHKFNLRIFAKTQPSHSYQNFVVILNSKLSPNAQLLPIAAYSHQSTFHHFTSWSFTLFQAYLCHKDARGLRENLQSSKLPLFPPIITNAVPLPASLYYLPVSCLGV